jgi:hypothetical protein
MCGCLYRVRDTDHYEPNGDKEWHADAFRIVVILVEQPKVLLDY